jgi:glutaredoxin
MKQSGNLFHVLIVMMVFIVLFLIPACSGAIFLKDGTEIPRDEISDVFMNNTNVGSDSPFPIQFFYSINCGSCRDAQEFLRSFERKNPSVPIEYRNLGYPEDNKKLFTEYKNQFRYLKISYPAIFIGNIGITGSSDIIHTTDQIVKGYENQ